MHSYDVVFKYGTFAPSPLNTAGVGAPEVSFSLLVHNTFSNSFQTIIFCRSVTFAFGFLERGTQSGSVARNGNGNATWIP